jgi:cation:H+ antiporter
VGTALPESTIPIIALISGAEGEEVAVGAVIGAPFMLATVAMILVSGSAIVFRKRRSQGQRVEADQRTMRRDIFFFLPVFAFALLLGLGVPSYVRYAAAVLLVAVYVFYVVRTIKKGGDAGEEELKPLMFDTSKGDPPNAFQLGLQFVVGLGMIIGGAELFVEELKAVAQSVGVPVLVLSLVLAPLASELPEKFNSAIWMRNGKDNLALGNITGAMVFQSTIPVAFLLCVIEWDLDRVSIIAGVVALVGATLAYVAVRRGVFTFTFVIAWAVLFVGFVAYALYDSPAQAPPAPTLSPAPPGEPPPPVAPPPALPPPG